MTEITSTGYRFSCLLASKNNIIKCARMIIAYRELAFFVPEETVFPWPDRYGNQIMASIRKKVLPVAGFITNRW
jgi:hypothetical protein